MKSCRHVLIVAAVAAMAIVAVGTAWADGSSPGAKGTYVRVYKARTARSKVAAAMHPACTLLNNCLTLVGVGP